MKNHARTKDNGTGASVPPGLEYERRYAFIDYFVIFSLELVTSLHHELDG